MTIDERLEKLVERHEALCQTVEIIAGMQRENEARFAKNEERLAQVMEAINGLTRIVASLEDRQQ
jgi:hypothetical protein